MKRSLTVMMLMLAAVVAANAQQTIEQRAAIGETAVGLDAKAAPAIEARLLTQTLNGSDEYPVTNVKLAVKNTTSLFYNYVSGWATFYDGNGVRCGEGLFKLDALAPQESAEVDTPGLRLRCAPSTWRIVATNLMTRSVDIAKPAEAQAAPVAEPLVPEKPAPVNFVISIDGEEHPVQVNNPIVLRLGNRNRTLVLKPAQP